MTQQYPVNAGQLPRRIDVPDGTGFEALIFDWDGTLVDSRHVCCSGQAQARTAFGVTLDPGWHWLRETITSSNLLALRE